MFPLPPLPPTDTVHFILAEFVGGPRDGERAVYAVPSRDAAVAPKIISVPMGRADRMALYDPDQDPFADVPCRVGEYHQQSVAVNTVTAFMARIASSTELLDLLAEKAEPSVYVWRGEW